MTSGSKLGRAVAWLAGGALLLVVAASAGPLNARAGIRHSALWRACPDPYPAKRDPNNPLMLRTPPGSDPLNGARFFVDGPRHGDAAGAIARLLGVNPTRYPDDYSWARFKDKLEHGRLHSKLEHHPGIAWKVRMLEKIADQPEAQRFSAASFGGGRAAAWDMAIKIFCHNMTADPGSIPIVSTYFLHPDVGGSCPSPAEIAAARPKFERSINEIVAATGRRPVVYLLELDAIGSSSCMAQRGDLGDYLSLFRYEIEKVGSLPHAVVYAEAGYSDSHSAGYTARALNKAGVRHIRGFFTNDTHTNWTINEVRWAQKISRMTGGAHFIVNTAQNGRGPKKNPHPGTQGTNDLCNPPGRGLGPLLDTAAGFSYVDAFMWTHVPGNSSGHCNGGPSSGTFWPARAIGLASRANGQLGSGYPSRPY